ncbi:MAG TPA: ABC transporter permease [Actinomycetales bacterium]|nr:ABC transporter permease [Actinomycetales bacterium]
MRHKGRTALVGLMIGLPVLAVATVDVLARSDQLSPQDRVQLVLGDAQAQVRIQALGARILQDERAEGIASVGEPDPSSPVKPDDPPGAVVDAISNVVGAGNVLVTSNEGGVRFTVGDRTIDTNGVELDSSDGWLGYRKLLDGRLPGAQNEVAVSAPLARHAELAIGDQIAVDDASHAGAQPRLLHVVAVLESPAFSREVIGPPGSLWNDEQTQQRKGVTTSWFVRGPAAVTWDQVLEMNAFGVTVFSRDVVLDPPPREEIPFYAEFGDTYSDSSELVTAGAVVAGLVVLEVALLAGPAFAVGARRSRRQLALVAAAGGEKRHVRAVVLAGGVVIGLGASLLGVVGGVGLAAALRPVLEQFEKAYLPTLHIKPLDLLALLAVGTGTAVAAALVPAIQASRQDVVAALAGRRGQVKVRAVVPVIGVVVAVLGTTLAVLSALSRQRTGILAGAILAELGLVATTGFLVAAVGRTAGWLPLSGRIAVRDAARQRGRTAPAVAAVMTAVAGAVAAGLVMTTDDARHERAYQPSAAMGTAILQFAVDVSTLPEPVVWRAELERAERVMRQHLPAVDAVPMFRPSPANGLEAFHVYAETDPARACPLWQQEGPLTDEQMRELAADERCSSGGISYGTVLNELVDDGSTIAALTGEDDPAVRAALDAGSVIVANPNAVWPDGKARLKVETFGADEGETMPTTVVVPAVAAALPGDMLVLPHGLLDELGAEAVQAGIVVPTSVVPTEAETERATAALRKAGLHDEWLYVERGPTDRSGFAVLLLAVAALVVALGATGIAVGLAAADSRADLATLAAVGAAPRMRRRVAGAQAAVVAVLGTALGVVAGGTLGAVIVLMMRHEQPFPDLSWQLVVPWPELAALGVGIPTLATLAGLTFTRSRLPMVRRLGQ